MFVYQAAEVDLQGPAGQGSGGLTYFFTNARVAATSRVDLQGTYHRGRSIDSRTITEDQLNGRPISPKALEGLLFESAGGRVNVTVARGIRAFAGYSRDRNNRDDEIANRVTAGGSVSSVLGSGVDLNVSLSRFDRGAAGSYECLVPVGRPLDRLTRLPDRRLQLLGRRRPLHGLRRHRHREPATHGSVQRLGDPQPEPHALAARHRRIREGADTSTRCGSWRD